MKSVKYVAIGIAVALGLAGTIVNADAKELTITGSFSGTFTPLGFDTNNDGGFVFLNITEGESNQGLFSSQGPLEFIASGNACSLADGTSGAELVLPDLITGAPWTVVLRFRNRGDLLTLAYNSATFCVDFITLRGEGEETLTVIGGTGRFANATGTGVFHTSLQVLTGFDEFNAFGQQSGEINISVNVEYPLGDPVYCLLNVNGPCGAGEGDCDSDAECQSGLTCVHDVGAKYGFRPAIDVCEAP